MNLVEQNQFLQQHNCLTFTSTMCPDIIEANYVDQALWQQIIREMKFTHC